MSKIALTPNVSGTGTLTIAAPNTSTDRTLTLPDSTGTIDTLGRAGNVLQVVQAVKTNRESWSMAGSGTYYDISGLSASITPSSASNKIIVRFDIGAFGLSSSVDALFRIVRDSTVIGIGDSGVVYPSTTAHRTRANELESISGSTYIDSPSTTSAVTYKIQWCSPSGGSATINCRTSSNVFGAISTITLMEIAA